MIRILFLSLLCICSFSSYAKGHFSDIPVLYDGRVQPMGSFARSQLKIIHGDDTLESASATEWLIETLFSPQTAIKTPIFKGVSVPASYEDLLQMDHLDEQTLYKMLVYERLLGSLSMFHPMDINGKEETYLSLQQKQPNHPALAPLYKSGQSNAYFKVIDLDNDGGNGAYASPWQTIAQGLGSPKTASQFNAWNTLVHAYHTQDKDTWNNAVSTLSKPSLSFTLERVYTSFQPISVAIGLYIVTCLLIFIGKFTPTLPLQTLSLYTGVTAIIIHIFILIVRILILDRPPVGTLYESMLFVSWIVGICGFWYRQKHHGFYGLTCFMSGLILLLSFHFKPNGDEFPLLEAVLNTNFWLATHVICITIGYGWCLFLSLVAHLALWHKKTIVTMVQLQKLVITSLLFVIIGTLLGGIWADQSWGRFWGWDPKENGALLIALWIIWLIHGKMSGHIKHVYYLAGLAFLSVIVALSWFGVNLLSVGLHSYGFIEGIAFGLFAFCAIEITIILGLVHRTRKIIS